MVESKPFGISKRAVWEAYRRVKENRGAAGVDHQSQRSSLGPVLRHIAEIQFTAV